jgi:ankyrin repeat protein
MSLCELVQEGRTALFRAVEVEALECVEQLLTAGASTDVTDEVSRRH